MTHERASYGWPRGRRSMGHTTDLGNLEDTLNDLVRDNLIVSYCQPPSHDGLLDVVMQVFAGDGDLELTQKSSQN